MSRVTSQSRVGDDESEATLKQFIWEITLRRALRNLLFLFLTFLVAVVNVATAACTIGLSVLLMAAPFRYESLSTDYQFFLSPVDTIPEALALGIAGAAMLFFSIIILIFMGEIELSATRRMFQES